MSVVFRSMFIYLKIKKNSTVEFFKNRNVSSIFFACTQRNMIKPSLVLKMPI